MLRRFQPKIKNVNKSILKNGLHTNRIQKAMSNFNMPSMSPTMTEGSVSKWNIKEGDAFSAGDVLLEIETDKAQIEVEAPEDGILAKILLKAGSEKVPIGQPIAILAEEGDDLSNLEVPATPVEKESVKVAEVENKVEKASPQSQTKKSKHYSPAVSHLLSNYEIKDVEAIPFTGEKGRLSKGDVLNYIKANNISKIKIQPSTQAKPIKSAPIPIQPTSGYTDIPTTNMRKVIAQRLTESKAQVPHNYTTKEINVDKLEELRKSLFLTSQIKLSINDFIIRACALALKDTPEVNVHFNPNNENSIDILDNIDIAVAVATPTGLFTPIVKDADKKGLNSISNEIKDMASRAKENKLKPHEYQGGTFGISNLGMFGIKSFTAIINPPQACNLAVSGVQEKLMPESSVVQDDSNVLDDLIEPKTKSIIIKPNNIISNDILDQLINNEIQHNDNNELIGIKKYKTIQVTLSNDERAVDQLSTAKFLDRLQFYLANPNHLLL